LVGRHKDTYFVGDLVRFQADASGVATRIKRVAELDGKRVRIYVEQEPGSSGKITIDYFAKRVLRNFRVEGVRTTGSKVDRARPVATAAAEGNLLLVEGHWNADFLDEAAAFPVGSHDDQIDAVSGGFAQADYEPFQTFSFRIRDL
jgi:predicted phage terminase large subunit-like protein